MNKVINEQKDKINRKLATLKITSVATKMEAKRQSLLSVLYDPDNGIATLKGKSREEVRIAIIKIIYMFFKVPDFFFKGFFNFMITGPAGSGKTKIASVLAHTLQNLGILATNTVIMATKQNLTAEYVGQSAPRTRKLLASSLEGVLFIDEAYTLTPCPGSSSKDTYSEEAVGELINFLDKFIGCFVVVVAGYKDKMYDCFLAFNEGMQRRFPKVIDLIPYSTDDLYNIFETFLKQTITVSDHLSKEKRVYIKSVLHSLNEAQVFNNQAGDMLNLANVIAEDAVLLGKKYDEDRILFSFKKFCAAKNLAIL
jgi:SpoVK/Ycf46/Vps4 family AAA+-type ATPase